MISGFLLKGINKALCSLLLLFFVNVSYAVIETYEFSNSTLEARYRQLSAELRCPKCQNQNIADSNAPIAQDLRKLLYTQLEAGASDDEILEYMVARYGEFVRYKPRFSGATLILWLMPMILLAGAIALVFTVLRSARNKGPVAEGVITTQEQRQLDELLAQADRSLDEKNKPENPS